MAPHLFPVFYLNSSSKFFPHLFVSGVVLFPESTLPLRVLQPTLVAAVERALSQVDAPYTIGVVCELLTAISAFLVPMVSVTSLFSK